MGSKVQRFWFRVLIGLGCFYFAVAGPAQASAPVEGLTINQEEQNFQITTLARRYTETHQFYSQLDQALWHHAVVRETTTASIHSELKLNETLDIVVSFGIIHKYTKQNSINIWAGTEYLTSYSENSYQSSLSLNYSIMSTPIGEIVIIIPVLDTTIGVKASWIQDPLVIVPQIHLKKKTISMNLGCSFVVNQQFAFSANLQGSYSESKNLSLGGQAGLVYRWSGYRSIHVTGFFGKGRSSRAGLEIGTTYGGNV